MIKIHIEFLFVAILLLFITAGAKFNSPAYGAKTVFSGKVVSAASDHFVAKVKIRASKTDIIFYKGNRYDPKKELKDGTTVKAEVKVGDYVFITAVQDDLHQDKKIYATTVIIKE